MAGNYRPQKRSQTMVKLETYVPVEIRNILEDVAEHRGQSRSGLIASILQAWAKGQQKEIRNNEP